MDDAGLVCTATPNSQLKKLGTGEFLAVVNGKTKTLRLQDYADRAAAVDSGIAKKDQRNPFIYLARYNIGLPEFDIKHPCQGMGVNMEQYGRYNIKFSSTENFADWNGLIKAPYGYYSSQLISKPLPADPNEKSFLLRSVVARMLPQASGQLPFAEQVALISIVPLRRELTSPWLTIIARIGATGGQEQPYNPDFTDPYVFDENITAKREGELFFFVNDIVIGFPYGYDHFYKNNTGSARVLITRR